MRVGKGIDLEPHVATLCHIEEHRTQTIHKLNDIGLLHT